MRQDQGRNVRERARRNRAVFVAAATAAVAALNAWRAEAGQTNNQVTISLSGSTAMRNFTISEGFTLVQPGTQLTLSNGTSGATATYPGNLNYWDSGLLYQLSPLNAGAISGDTADAVRLEWHEQGSVEGMLDLINDQIVTLPGNAATRNPTGANRIFVNRNPFTGTGSINGYTLGAFGTAQGQSKVQMAISDVNAVQGFAAGASNAASWTRTPGQAGYGRGNQVLAGGGASNLANFGNAGGRVELIDGSIANMSGLLANGTTAPTNGAWTSAGVGNLESKAVAVTATLFVANPGTGLDRLNRTDAQWLQTTGRVSNGAAFNMTTRDVNSGTRNVAAVNTGVDPSWAVGVNDGALGTSAENALGTGIRFSNKTSGGNLRTTVANARMAVGTLGLSDGLANTVNSSAQPLRGLDYSNSADGSSGYVRASAASITDGTYAIWQNETYVTVKAPDGQYGNTNGANILGDTPNADVQKFRNNILTSSRVYTGTNTAIAFAPSDAMVNNGFVPTQLVKLTKTLDGIGTTSANPNYTGDDDRQAFLDDFSRSSKFAIGGTGANTSPTNVTSGTGFYNDGSQSGTNMIALTAYNNSNGVNAGGNFLVGNFNQKGTRDLAALQSAKMAQAALFASGKSVNIATGSNFATVVTGVTALDTMTGQNGGNSGLAITGATKGDLIAMGDFNADGRFDGKDLYQFATGAALADSGGTAVTTLTPAGGETLGDALRRGVLRKNDALDYLQTNATPQQRIDASANLAVDPSGTNAFNKFDLNRDGRVSRNDAAIVDKFVGASKTDLTAQLGATINADGSTAAGTQKPINLYQVGLIDGANTIGTGRWTGSGSNVTVTATGDFAMIRQALGTHLQSGDTRFRGQVDFGDLSQIVSRGHFNDGTMTNRWSDGDFTGDGKVDFGDLSAIVSAGVFNNGAYDAGTANGPTPDATPTLTGTRTFALSASAGDGEIAASSPLAVAGDATPDFIYDPATGHLKFARDGFDSTKKIRILNAFSAGNKFIVGVGYTSNGNDSFDNDTAGAQQVARFNGNGVTVDPLDLGAILPTGLTLAQVQSDLSLYFNYDGSGATDPNGIQIGVMVPEPTSLSLLGLAGVGLLARRRRRHQMV